MKIKKFIAPDIRRAIRMVRDEQGPEAVILSNRRVEGGVEIVSALDYDAAEFNANLSKSDDRDAVQNQHIGVATLDARVLSEARVHSQADIAKQNIQNESNPIQGELVAGMREELKYLRKIVETRFFDLEWSNYAHSNPVSAEVIKKLMNCGITPKLARDLVKALPNQNTVETAWGAVLEKLSDRIRIADDDIVDKGGIVALVGPTGVGKTTTIAKLAARYALRRGVRHAALITTDNYRVGAHEQLRTYGRLLDIPMRSASSKEDLQAQLDDLIDKDLILIDTAGMSQRDMRISEQLSVLRDTKINIKVYLVIAATGQLAGIEEVINIFRCIDLDGCIITKIDEAISIGPAVSAIVEQKIPIAYISDGQRVPEDLHLARADKLINKDKFDVSKNEESTVEEVMRFMAGRTAKNAH